MKPDSHKGLRLAAIWASDLTWQDRTGPSLLTRRARDPEGDETAGPDGRSDARRRDAPSLRKADGIGPA